MTPEAPAGQSEFACLSNETLADVWYAAAGAEIRHPGCFTALLEAAHDALIARLGPQMAAYVDDRFKALRAVDATEDAVANARAASDAACDDASQLARTLPHEGGTS